jgi:hypothetical protein
LVRRFIGRIILLLAKMEDYKFIELDRVPA